MPDPIAPTANELAAAQAFWDAHLAGDAWPFSLQIDGVRVASPTGWAVERAIREPDPDRQELTFTALHADHGLVLRCVAVRYRRHPVIEWTVHLEQGVSGRSPMVSEVLGLDASWQHGRDQPFLVRTYQGDDHLQRTIFQPQEHAMHSGRRLSMAPTSNAGQEPDGRCSSGAFPYFTIQEAGVGRYSERPLAKGFHVAVGWPGRWTASLSQDRDMLTIQAGQDRTRFRLEPGESYQAPLIALCFFQGPDRLRAMNLWRRWMLACNLPRLNGALPPPMLEASTCGFLDEMGRATEANQIEYIDRHRQAGLPITHWWMDAGWYPCWLEYRQKNAWWITGTWEPDRQRFPNGLRAIADHAHQHDIGAIVWFEPERVAPETWLAKERPQWLLMRKGTNLPGPVNSWANFQVQGENGLLDLGNPEALEWLIERVSSLIKSEGIDVYRQDFNINPLPNWRANDSTDREGLVENRHTRGYLAYWDALRERFPGLLLDSCASGGRRNDLETMRRSVALHPTDHAYDDLPVKQCLRHTLFQWLPFFGGPVLPLDRVDAYAFRSTMGLSTVIGFDLQLDHDLPLLRKLTTEWREVADLFYGDYYPLTHWTLAEDAWMAWQFHRHEQGDGLIQVFRRRESPIESACFPLHGLDPEARYVFHDFDVPGDTEHRGADLAAGWRIAIPERRTARLIHYWRKR
jgi:alpha-galactosidase